VDTSDCTEIPLTEVEPNDTPPDEVNVFADGYSGAIDPFDDEDCVSVSATSGQHIVADTRDFGDGACDALELDSEITIFGTNGTTRIGNNDDADGDGGTLGFCSHLDVTANATGDFFVCVTSHGAGSRFVYQLLVDVQ